MQSVRGSQAVREMQAGGERDAGRRWEVCRQAAVTGLQAVVRRVQ
jgi:hypothetical protein